MKKYQVRLFYHTFVDVIVKAKNEDDAIEEAYCMADTPEFAASFQSNAESEIDDDPDVTEL